MTQVDGSRTLVITAHPDDVDFGAAGTVAHWTDEGTEVTYCIVTDGDAGGFDPAIPRTEVPRIRQAEQRAAAQAVGVHDVQFLGYRDGEVVPSLQLRRDLSRVIRSVRPFRVVCPSSERNFLRLPASHPDHLAVGEAALCAIYPDARNPFAFPELLAEGLEAFIVREIWIIGHQNPDTFVDITDTFERKAEALRAHKSQHANPDELIAMVRNNALALAGQAGFSADRFAEGFLVSHLS